MNQMHYNVFISSKSEDYHLAENIYDYLTANGLSVFIASEELRKIGEAQYAYAIDEALDNSDHMIVVASSLDHIQSKWVKYEWSTFSNDIKSGFRNGNLLTILSESIELKTLPASLRHQQSFHFNSYKKELLDFLPAIREKTDVETEDITVSVAVFKFYSTEKCQITLEGKKVGIVEGMSDEPYYLPVSRKGDYRFKALNVYSGESKIIDQHIDTNEEKIIKIEWVGRKPFKADQEWPERTVITGDQYTVDIGVLKFNMIRVEGGEMMMGATSEQADEAEYNEIPAHLVSLNTFYIGKFPVTQNLWATVMGYNKSRFVDKESERFSESSDFYKSCLNNPVIKKMLASISPLSSSSGWGIREQDPRLRYFKSTDEYHYPAENLSHDEALEFVRRLSMMTNIQFALPTEEEWEYAARGGQKSQGFKYAGSNDIDEVAWHKDNSEESTHPIGEKKPNELGIYDMSGNVWEWTETLAHSYASEVKPEGTIFIRRGGSWWQEARSCRVSRRYASDHTKKTSGLGLRVVIRENVE